MTRLDAGQLAAKCNVQEKTEHMALREHHGTHNFKKEYIQSTARHYLLLKFVEIYDWSNENLLLGNNIYSLS